MGYSIDINCDLGEGIGKDADIMPYISSCNIACGGHAGDKNSIKETLKLALKHNVKIGAHPSYPDTYNFGRKKMNISLAELQKSIEDQIKLLKRIVVSNGGVINYIKPHGALYNEAAKDKNIAEVIIKAVKNTSQHVYLYVPYNSVIHKMAINNNLLVKFEAFADRNYNADLSLVSRNNDNAILDDPKLILKHMLKMIIHKKVISVDKIEVPIMADTFCMHGDNPNTVKILKFLTRELPKYAIEIK